MSFAELVKQQRSKGLEPVEEAIDDSEEDEVLPRKRDKNMPMEMTSKRPVSRKRQAIEPARKQSRDPRFEKFTGKFDPHQFKQSYGFVEEYQESECRMIKDELKKEKNAERRDQLKKSLVSLTSRVNAKKLKDKQSQLKREWRKAEQEQVAATGKKPFFLKKAEFKKLELVQNYKEMAAKGQDMDKLLEKRRKKNATKDHKLVPYKRRS